MQKSTFLKRTEYSLTKRFLAFLVVLVLLAGWSLQTQAAFNSQINYQGKLTNSSGVAVTDGTYSIVFSLYTVSSGGSNIWTETQNVTVEDGLFSVMLGSDTALTGVDFDQTLYLGVNVEADGEMSPRKVLGAVPAAFVADTVDGVDSTSFVRSDEADEIDVTDNSNAALTITQSGTGDILNLFDGGSEVFTVLDGGNVGIGTTSPSYKLDVSGTINTSSGLRIGGINSLTRWSSGSHGNFLRAYDTGDNRAQIALVPNGTPTFTRSRLLLGMTDMVSDETNYEMLTMAARADDSSYWISSEAGGTGTLRPIKFRFNSTDAMTIATDGNVGIGTSSPERKLHVAYSTSGAGGIQITGQAPNVRFEETDTTDENFDLRVNGGYFAIGTNNDDFNSFSEALVVDSSGNVGIGTTSPGYALDVTDDSSTLLRTIATNTSAAGGGSYFLFGNDDGAAMADGHRLGSFFAQANDGTQLRSGASIEFFADGTWSGSSRPTNIIFGTVESGSTIIEDRMIIQSDGAVGVGTITPETPFHIADNGGLTRSWSPFTGTTFLFEQGDTSRNADMSIIANDNRIAGFNFGDTADQNMGTLYYDNSTDSFRFGTNNTQDRVVIDSSGQVGIGTTSPSVPLHVSLGDAGTEPTWNSTDAAVFENVAGTNTTVQIFTSNADQGAIGFSDNDARNVGFIAYDHSADAMRFITSSSETMRIDTDGNVGIGKTNPTEKLHVVGDNIQIDTPDFGGILINQTSTGDPQFRFSLSGTQTWLYGSDTSDSDKFYIRGSGGASDQFLTITQGGNVGIGTTSPEVSVHSSGSLLATGNNVPTSAAGIKLSYSSNIGDLASFDWGASAWRGMTIRGSYVATQASGSEITRVTSTGLGVGTSSPSNLLDVSQSTNGATTALVTNTNAGTSAIARIGATNGTGNIFLNATGTSHSAAAAFPANAGVIQTNSAMSGGLNFLAAHSSAPIRFYSGGSDAANLAMVIDTSQQVGIGTSSPNSLLHIKNNSTPYLTIESDASNAGVLIDGTKTTDGEIAFLNVLNAGDSVAGLRADREGANDAAAWIMQTQPTGGTLTERLRITSTGNVGIGTTDPGYLLDVQGTGVVTNYQRNTSDANALRAIANFRHTTDQASISDGFGAVFNFEVEDAGGSNAMAQMGAYRSGGTDNAGTFTIRTSNTSDTIVDALVIDHDQNVGIGITSPGSKLTVFEDRASQSTGDPQVLMEGDYAFQWLKSNTGDAHLLVSGDSSKAGALHTGGLGMFFEYDETGVFGVRSSPRANLESGTFGDTTDGTGLKLQNDNQFGIGGGGVGTADSYGAFSIYGDTSQNVYVPNGEAYFTGGNVGIGETSPSYLLDITSSASAQIRSIATNTSTTTGGSFLVLGNNDGAAMADGHRLGGLFFQAAEDASNNLASGAGITADATELWDASGHGTRLEFIIVPENSTTLTTAMTLDSDGALYLGGAGTANPLVMTAGSGQSAVITAEATDATRYSGMNILDSTSTLAASFAYGNPSAAAFTDEFVFATRQSDIDMVFYQGGATASDEQMRLTPTELVINEQSVDLDFRVESNGNANMLFVDGGNDRVGIGTAAPSAQFHVLGSSAGIFLERTGGSEPFVLVYDGNFSHGGQIRGRTDVSGFNFTDAGDTTDYMSVTAGGIGIGQTSPQTNLHVSESNTSVLPGVEIEQLSTGDAGLQFSISGDAYALGIDNSDSDKFKISYAAGEGTAVLGTNDRLVIDASGNVGIGTTSPSLKLDVNGGIELGDSGSQQFQFLNTNGRLNIQGQSSASAGSMWFFTKDGDGTDNIAITIFAQGTPDNITNFEGLATGFIASTNTYEISSTAAGSGTVHPIKLYTGANTSQLYLDTDGDVGIGTNSPQQELHVVTTADDSPVRFEDTDGYCEINPTTTTWSCTSDESLKTNITSLDRASSFESVLALRPVEFEWKTNRGKARQGLIAQEVEEIFPELISTDKTTGLKSVAYGGLTIHLISAVQELNDKIDTQLAAMGVTPESAIESIMHFVELVVDRLRVKTIEIEEGIQIKDQETGEIYCVVVRGGELVHEEGECGSQNSADEDDADGTGGSSGGGTVVEVGQAVDDEGNIIDPSTGEEVDEEGSSAGEEQEDPASEETPESETDTTDEAEDPVEEGTEPTEETESEVVEEPASEDEDPEEASASEETPAEEPAAEGDSTE